MGIQRNIFQYRWFLIGETYISVRNKSLPVLRSGPKMKAAVLFFCVVIPLILGVWKVEAQGLSFDIYTDRGGQGIGVPGGTYRVGETVRIGISVSVNARITINLHGPHGEVVTIVDREFEPDSGYIWNGRVEERHIGRWEVIGQACPVGTYIITPTCAQDTTVFFVEPEEVVTTTETITQTTTTTETRCPGLTAITQYMTQYVWTTTTLTKEVPVVPGSYYVFTVIFAAAAAGLGHLSGKRLLRPSRPDLTSVTKRLTAIENAGKARPSLPILGSVADVEQMLRSIGGSVNKVGDALKRLEAVKDEEMVVETLAELVEQVRNSSDDVGSFTEFLAKRVAGPREGKELPWFNVLTGNLMQIERALDSATIMVRNYASGELLFESLTRKYAFLASSAHEAERAFTLADIEQINLALDTLMKAKVQLDRDLNGVSQGLADWYMRLSCKKYLWAGTSIFK